MRDVFIHRTYALLSGLKKRQRDQPKPVYPARTLSHRDTNAYLRLALVAEKPGAVTRPGMTESLILKHVASSPSIPWLRWVAAQKAKTYSGIFPTSSAFLRQFATRYLADIEKSSALAVLDARQQPFLATCTAPLLRAKSMQPYLHAEPWSAALRHKKVLVIHPFDLSIRKQYEKRKLLFEQPVLPTFELLTFRPVVTFAGNTSGFQNWFEALDSMITRIRTLDFDVALVGAGAYGLPLCVAIQEMGKMALHSAGATQMMFGIFGERWAHSPLYRRFINEHWVRPLPEERPRLHKLVENGCYW